MDEDQSSEQQGSSIQEGSEFLFDPAEFGEEAAEEATRGESAFRSIAKSRAETTPEPPHQICKIRLANILGFVDSTVYPDRFTVMVGANNSGKSS